jgi:hypothetical protein
MTRSLPFLALHLFASLPMRATFVVHLTLLDLVTVLMYLSRDSSVGIALGYGLDDQALGIFLFTTASRTALGPIQPPIQWVRGSLSLGVNLTFPLLMYLGYYLRRFSLLNFLESLATPPPPPNLKVKMKLSL